MFPRTIFFLLLAACLLAPSDARAGKRVALVVGVGAYANVPKLANPPRDAKAVAAALKQLGFETTLLLDPDRPGFERGIRAFGQAAEGSEAAVFYYAGHALEAGGHNALLPVSAKIASGRDVPYETIDLDLVLNEVDGRTKTLLIFLDSCRDNPFVRTLSGNGAGAGRGIVVRGAGLAMPASDVSGTLIAFATAPGRTAADGSGENSPFTTALLHHVATPGVEVRQMLAAVRKEVREATAGAQIPWDTSALEDSFYFVAGKAAPASAPSVAQVADSRCTRDKVSGMSKPGGATAGLYVTNDGRGCTFSIWRNATERKSWDALALEAAPEHGTVTIAENRKVTYTPAKSYTGSDHFVIASNPTGTLKIEVTVKATGP